MWHVKHLKKKWGLKQIHWGHCSGQMIRHLSHKQWRKCIQIHDWDRIFWKELALHSIPCYEYNCLCKLLSVLRQVKLCKIIGMAGAGGGVEDCNSCNITHTCKNKIGSGQLTNVQVAPSCGAVAVPSWSQAERHVLYSNLRLAVKGSN